MAIKISLKKIPCVILAGGFGTRLSEETFNKPKPMIELGNLPILVHIIKFYYSYGIENFIICGGYKVNMIKDYFINSKYYFSDIQIDYSKSEIKLINKKKQNWKVKIINTGLNSMTGGRLLRVKKLLKNTNNFFFTYGDGLSDIDLNKLYNFHIKHKKVATLTSVYPEGRFGRINISKNEVTSFDEKKKGDLGRVNGGFFVLNKKIFNYIDNDNTIFEKYPLEKLSQEKQLMAFNHSGFWQPMDNLRDMNLLQKLWNDGAAPWKTWQD